MEAREMGIALTAEERFEVFGNFKPEEYAAEVRDRWGDSDAYRESAGRTQSDRRRAAALAARVVAEPSISRDAAVVAWSRPEPGPPDAVVLADRVESSRGRGRARAPRASPCPAASCRGAAR